EFGVISELVSTGWKLILFLLTTGRKEAWSLGCSGLQTTLNIHGSRCPSRTRL
ncbi:hypothetical protein NDU88_007148, partial [Pleurodeles waltl]